jgi:hypothetical protein
VKFRIARFWFPKPPRHASPVATSRTRRAKSPAKTEGSIAQRPRPDYADAGDLPHVKTGSEGQAVFHQIGNPPAPEPEAPLGSTDATVSFETVAFNPEDWYPDLYRNCPNPTPEVRPEVRELNSSHFPEDHTPCAHHAVQQSLDQYLGNSALRHAHQPTDPWFREGVDNGAQYGSALDDFWDFWQVRDAREAQAKERDLKVAGLNRYRKITTTGTGEHVPGSLDTGVFAPVVQSVFDVPAGGAK